MTESEIKVVQMIRDSKDPTRAMHTAVDMLTRMVAGESWESICIDYGMEPEEIKKRMGKPC